MSDQNAEFKAFQGEWEAESAYFLNPDEEAKAAFLRVFKDKGGLVRIDLQIADNERGNAPAKHIQIVVGKSQLMRRLAEPQDIP